MPTVTVTTVDGEKEIEPSASRFFITADGETFQPAVVREVEIEHNGQNSKTTDQCGNTERSRQGNKGWTMRVEGIVTGNNVRQGNLSLQMLRDEVAPADEVTVRSSVLSATFVESNVVITWNSSLVAVETDATRGKEDAYEFQLQLGEKESSN